MESKNTPNGTTNANGKVKINGIPTSNPLDVLESDVTAPDSYIISAHEANVPLSPESPTDSTFSFLSRVLSIPFIHDTTLKAHEYASKYTLTRFVLTQTETTVKKAATIASGYAAPFAEKYKPQLLKADHLGCQSLDIIERKFPVMLEPTDIVLNNVKEAPKKVFDEVKEKIVHVRPVPQANDHFETVLKKLLPARDLLVSSVKESPHKVLDDVKQTVLHLVGQANKNLQHLMNTWLPEEDMNVNGKEVPANANEKNRKDNGHTAEEEVHQLVFLANEMKSRLVARVTKKAHSLTSFI